MRQTDLLIIRFHTALTMMPDYKNKRGFDLFTEVWYNKLTENLEFAGANDENFIYDWWHYGSWKNNCVPTAQTGFTE